jgi:DNA polymerase III epsilon subunit-like protein
MTVFLDIETTGLLIDDRIIEIAVIGDDNEVLFHSLVNPERPIPSRVRGLTGLTDEMVLTQPKLQELVESIRSIFLSSGPVVIYNQSFDRRFFPSDFWADIETKCALNEFEKTTGNVVKLAVAAKFAEHLWDNKAHRAIADARACRTVWRWCEERSKKMEDRFHNRSAAEIAEMAFSAQQQIKAAEKDFDMCKSKLIEIARGAKLQIEVPEICRVTVSAPPNKTDKKTYYVNSELFENLDAEIRQRLLESNVIKERQKSDEPRSPIIRVYPL